MNQQTIERRAALSDLMACASANCPNTPAHSTAQILFSSLHGATDKPPRQHAQTMSLIASCISQIQAGATELDLNAKPRSGVLTNTRRELGLP